MRSSTWKRVIAQGVGLVCYIAGMMLFLSIAIDFFAAPSGERMATSIEGYLPTLLTSVALIAVGRLVSWKYGGGVAGWNTGRVVQREYGGPNQSRLEQLGYRVPPEDAESDPGRGIALEGGRVACTECGTPNDSSFTYCRECSAELPA